MDAIDVIPQHSDRQVWPEFAFPREIGNVKNYAQIARIEMTTDGPGQAGRGYQTAAMGFQDQLDAHRS